MKKILMFLSGVALAALLVAGTLAAVALRALTPQAGEWRTTVQPVALAARGQRAHAAALGHAPAAAAAPARPPAGDVGPGTWLLQAQGEARSTHAARPAACSSMRWARSRWSSTRRASRCMCAVPTATTARCAWAPAPSRCRCPGAPS